jgi:hypothetical protein
VLLSGEAGVGKTTVLRAAARRRTDRIDWLWGTCEPMLSPTPLGPLVDWLDRMPPALAAAVRAGRHAAEVLSGVLAMLRDPTKPTVLVVDDAQWADSATLDLLRYLGRRIESTSALLILSYRDDALGSDHRCWACSRGCRRAAAPLGAVAFVARWRCRDGAASGPQPRAASTRDAGQPVFVTELLAGDPQACRPRCATRSWRASRHCRPRRATVIELASVSPTPIEVELLATAIDDPGVHRLVHRCRAVGHWMAAGCAFAMSWRDAPSRRRSRRVGPPPCTLSCSMP